MSLWVKNMNGDDVIIKNNGVSKGSTEDKFLCPSCGESMWFTSQSSNMRGAHFKGHHKDGCDIGFITENENAYKYNLSKKSLYDLLQSLIKDGIKTATPGTHRITGNGKGSQSPKTIKKEITSLRQLYNICANSSPDYEPDPGLKIKNIYCGISTAFLYTKYISGLHLVYAQFQWYNESGNIVRFHYPSESNKQLDVYVSFSNSAALRSFIKDNAAYIHCYFIILGEFHNNRCVLDSASQAIHLDKRNSGHATYSQTH